jgi:hypothetical protein
VDDGRGSSLEGQFSVLGFIDFRTFTPASLDIQTTFQKATVSSEDKDFMKMLMAFKIELAAAKKTVEEV